MGKQFQSTHSLRSATRLSALSSLLWRVSIHALLAECDSTCLSITDLVSGFNPRTPCGVRLSRTCGPTQSNWFQSTHSLRSATCQTRPQQGGHLVSIHALLAECDSQHVSYLRIIQCFNPRTPCGVRLNPEKIRRSIKPFQSTHSLRSATNHERHIRITYQVSIHALLAECDNQIERKSRKTKVSIHALLAECDVGKRLLSCLPSCFNPRTPCGVRRLVPGNQNCSTWFQSTHSLRSATPASCPTVAMQPVSIHALLAECDPIAQPPFLRANRFNPRTPCGVRLNLTP